MYKPMLGDVYWVFHNTESKWSCRRSSSWHVKLLAAGVAQRLKFNKPLHKDNEDYVKEYIKTFNTYQTKMMYC